MKRQIMKKKNNFKCSKFNLKISGKLKQHFGKMTKKDVTIVFMILYIVGECRATSSLKGCK